MGCLKKGTRKKNAIRLTALVPGPVLHRAPSASLATGGSWGSALCCFNSPDSYLISSAWADLQNSDLSPCQIWTCDLCAPLSRWTILQQWPLVCTDSLHPPNPFCLQILPPSSLFGPLDIQTLLKWVFQMGIVVVIEQPLFLCALHLFIICNPHDKTWHAVCITIFKTPINT